MSVEVQRVAIIGAGSAGLTAIKACLEEGLQPVCFDRRNVIAGTWNFTDEEVKGQACTMRSTVTNVPKEHSCYTDFPFDKEAFNFMHHTEYLKYFHQYAQHNDLYQYIQLETNVISVTKADDYETTGKWNVKYRLNNGQGDEEVTETFDAVMVGTGILSKPCMPDIKNMDKFHGSVKHSHAYKDPTPYVNRNVLVVGMGGSGADICTDLVHVANKIYMSRRGGTWILPRSLPDGYPAFMRLMTRAKMANGRFFLWYAETMLSRWTDHSVYGMKANYHFGKNEAFINDDFINALGYGRITFVPEVDEFLANGVKFKDGNTLEDIDDVVMATGYLTEIPVVSEDIVQIANERRPLLYKCVLPPDLSHPTMAMIGVGTRLTSSNNPLNDMQARWAARVFKGLIPVPSRDEMWRSIQDGEDYVIDAVGSTQSSAILGDYTTYLDNLAKDIGCMPSFWPLFIRDPKLAWHFYFGPVQPCQWRLVGPHKWPGARDAVINTWHRVYYPFNKTIANKKGFARVLFKLGRLLRR